MPNVTEDWTQAKLRVSDGAWTAERVFIVTDADSDVDAKDAAGVPADNDPHPSNSRLKVRDKSVEVYEKVVRAYKVSASYAIPATGSFGGSSGGEEDPLAEPHIVVWNRSLSSEPIDRVRNPAVTDPSADNYWFPIVNSARDGLSTPISRDFTERRFQVVRAEPFYDDGIATQWENTINNNVITIARAGTFAAGTLRLFTISPNDPIEEGQAYINVTYEFGVRADGWSVRVMDQGKRAWTTGGGSPYMGQIVTVTRKDDGTVDEMVDGEPVADDVLLDGKGAVKDTENFKIFEKYKMDSVPRADENPPGSYIENTPDATFLRWYPYEYKDFTLLGLA